MIHFLRNKKGENIIETEVFGDIDIGTFELNSSIYSEGYGKTLLNINNKDKIKSFEFIHDIDELDNLRVLYYEQLIRGKDYFTKSDVEKIITVKYKYVAKKYDLCYEID